jgi:hypothetical protein
MPLFFATLLVSVLWGLHLKAGLPIPLFVGVLSFYIGWAIASLAIAPRVYWMPLGLYFPLPVFIVGAIVSLAISWGMLRSDISKRRMYFTILGSSLCVFLIFITVPIIT